MCCGAAARDDASPAGGAAPLPDAALCRLRCCGCSIALFMSTDGVLLELLLLILLLAEVLELLRPIGVRCMRTAAGPVNSTPR